MTRRTAATLSSHNPLLTKCQRIHGTIHTLNFQQPHSKRNLHTAALSSTIMHQTSTSQCRRDKREEIPATPPIPIPDTLTLIAGLRRTEREIALATIAVRTGLDPVDGKPVSAGAALLYLTDWIMEQRIIVAQLAGAGRHPSAATAPAPATMIPMPPPATLPLPRTSRRNPRMTKKQIDAVAAKEEGLTNAEIARVLGITRTSVLARRARARRLTTVHTADPRLQPNPENLPPYALTAQPPQRASLPFAVPPLPAGHPASRTGFASLCRYRHGQQRLFRHPQ